MKKLLFLILVLCLSTSTVWAQAPNYLPFDPQDPNSDHWYYDVDDPTFEMHRYAGEPVGIYDAHHLESWSNGTLVNHTVWLQVRDEDGSIFNHQVSFDGGMNYTYMCPPICLVQSPLAAGSQWDYQCNDLPLEMTFTCTMELEMMFCEDEMYAYVVGVAQLYNYNWLYWTDYYVDGFGVAQMIWDGRDMMLNCVVSTESTTLDGLKSLYR